MSQPARHLIWTVALGAVVGCGGTPTTPSRAAAEPSAELATISGRVWDYGGGGRRPAPPGAYVSAIGGGSPSTLVPVDADGGYRLQLAPDSSAYLLLMTHFYGPTVSRRTWQPCVVEVRAGQAASTTTADIHMVSDRSSLGGSLPLELKALVATLSGVVYYAAADGSRLPLASAMITLDPSGDGGVIATTETDVDGRYALCGLPLDRDLYIYVAKDGLYVSGPIEVRVHGNAIFDVELEH